jgi:transposase InsO family protein
MNKNIPLIVDLDHTLINTDQGSQYTREIHTKRLKDLGITISMDGKGRATDNRTD